MKKYRIKQEFYDQWGATEETDIVSEEDLLYLSKAWDKPLNELLEQVEEMEKE